MLDGRVLVAGGHAGGQYLADAEIYDPITDTWSPTSSLNHARREHKAVLLPDGRVLVAGGFNGTEHLASTELFDPKTETWTLADEFNRRTSHSLTLLPGANVLTVGGWNGGFWWASAEHYDTATKQWFRSGKAQLPHSTHAAVLLQDQQVLVIGGDGTIGSSELLDPDGRSGRSAFWPQRHAFERRTRPRRGTITSFTPWTAKTRRCTRSTATTVPSSGPYRYRIRKSST